MGCGQVLFEFLDRHTVVLGQGMGKVLLRVATSGSFS
jgi:hypothetical protein